PAPGGRRRQTEDGGFKRPGPGSRPAHGARNGTQYGDRNSGVIHNSFSPGGRRWDEGDPSPGPSPAKGEGIEGIIDGQTVRSAGKTNRSQQAAFRRRGGRPGEKGRHRQV